MERGGNWDKGKSFDTFGLIVPYLVTSDAVGDPQAIQMWLDVNSERVQSGSTLTMIFGCATLVSYVIPKVIGSDRYAPTLSSRLI